MWTPKSLICESLFIQISREICLFIQEKFKNEYFISILHGSSGSRDSKNYTLGYSNDYNLLSIFSNSNILLTTGN
ncbi:hypothetical protein NARC_210026 [Candidatus Nitrosocosmicus arcticus]|uniref:Uncharacterized protein n=1 Tax=Candidatus Nitrosocosmicus arcticus TaxID=2035267 RepID=A0A557SR55_9ARCH|nr:hypothetical protein NARC_210026 [Candidatus Nitrosocosmicus arcticus]